MDIYEIFERGALANRGLDEFGTYEPMIEKINNDEIPVDEMKELLTDLYKVVSADVNARVELLKNDIQESGVTEIEETYGLDDYAVAMVVAQELK